MSQPVSKVGVNPMAPWICHFVYKQRGIRILHYIYSPEQDIYNAIPRMGEKYQYIQTGDI